MKNQDKISNVINAMQSLKLDGRLFQILETECGVTIVPSIFGIQNINNFNNSATLLRTRLINLKSDITVHAL